MVPNSSLCVFVIIFFASSYARPDQIATVDTKIGEEDGKSATEKISTNDDIDDNASTEVPRDKRGLGVILQGLVQALGYTTSPISYATLVNPTPPAPPQKPRAPTISTPKPATPAKPMMTARQRETLRFTGVVNFGNNSDLLGHLQQYERLFHGNATTAPPAASPASPPPPPPPRPQPRPGLGKPALLTPYFVPIPLPLAPNLGSPLPATAPRIVNQENTYAKHEESERYEGESKEISDEKDVRKDPPKPDDDRDTYIDEPQWKKKQRQREEQERQKYREENYKDEENSDENSDTEENDKYREEEIVEREKENTYKQQPQSEETNASIEEDTSEDDRKNSAEEDDKKSSYEEEDKKDNYEDDEKNNNHGDDNEKDNYKDDEKQNNYEDDSKDSYEDDKKNNSKEEGEEEEADSREPEKYTKKPEESHEDDDRGSASSGYESDDEKTDDDYKHSPIPGNPELGSLKSDYDKFKEPFDFPPKKVSPLSKQFGNGLPIRVYDDPFVVHGGLRNSYGESLEQGGRIDDSVADYFQRYKDPETGLFDSRKIQDIQGPREKDHWWQNHQTSGSRIDGDPLARIRQEYAPPTNSRYEEYNLEDDKTSERKILKEEVEDEEFDGRGEPSRTQYSPVEVKQKSKHGDDEETRYGKKVQNLKKEDEEEPVRQYGDKMTSPKNKDNKSAAQYRDRHRISKNEDDDEVKYTDKLKAYNNRNEEEVKKYTEKPKAYNNRGEEEVKRYTEKPRGYNHRDENNRYKNDDEDEEPVRQYERQSVRKKDPPSRYKYEEDEVAEPTITTYTAINALAETERTDIDNRNVESKKAEKMSPSNDNESVEESKDLKNYEDFVSKHPLPFKGFDFIKYSPYFRPIQIKYDPKKLERTADRILSYQYGSEGSRDGESGSEELFRGRNVASNLRVNSGKSGSDEYIVRQPYLRPIQLVYEPEKLLRTADKILSFHKQPSIFEQQKNRYAGKEEIPRDIDLPRPVYNVNSNKGPLRNYSHDEDRETNNSEEDDGPSTNYSDENDRGVNNSNEDTGPSKNYSQQENREENNSEENTDPSKNYSQQENRDENHSDENTGSVNNYSDEDDRRINNSREDNGSSKNYSEQNHRGPSNPEGDDNPPESYNQQDDRAVDYSNEDTDRSPIYEKQEDRSSTYQKQEDRSPAYEKEEDRSPNCGKQKDRLSDDEKQEGRSANYKKQGDRSQSYGKQEDRSSIERKIHKSAKPKIGLPERLTGKKLHEGESKEIQAWPAPFDHTFDSTERAKIVRLPKTEYSSRIRDEDVEPTYETPAILEFQRIKPLADSPRGLQVSPTSKTRTIDESRTSGLTKDNSRDSKQTPSYGTRKMKKTRITDRTRNRPRDLDIAPTDESPSIVKSRASGSTKTHSRGSNPSPNHKNRNGKKSRITDHTRDRPRDLDVAPTDESPSIVKSRASGSTKTHSRGSNSSQNHKNRNGKKSRVTDHKRGRPRDLDVAPTNESPSIEKSSSKSTGSHSTNKSRRRPKPESQNTKNTGDLEKKPKEPRITKNESESSKSRDDPPPIRLRIYQPRDSKVFSESEHYRPEELRDSEVKRKYIEDESLYDRQNKEISEPAAQSKTFEDPESAHDFFGLSQDDYTLRESDGSLITNERTIKHSTTPSPSDEKELIGLLIIPQDPNYQPEVTLTKFTTEPETETEQVTVNEYRNKVATLKDKRKEAERRNELETKMTEILDNLKSRLLLE